MRAEDLGIGLVYEARRCRTLPNVDVSVSFLDPLNMASSRAMDIVDKSTDEKQGKDIPR